MAEPQLAPCDVSGKPDGGVSDAFLQGDAPKIYFSGGHRAHAPDEIIRRARPFFDAAELTRISDVTDLDHVGIPVAQAIRPMSRALSVSQGKGMSLEDATAGAIMEGLEKWRAETCLPDFQGISQSDLPASETVADLSALALSLELLPERPEKVAMSWCRGRDLYSGAEVFLPFDTVSLDFSRSAEADFLVKSSNGLASGGTKPEAVLSALLELIERDSLADFFAQAPCAKARRRVSRAGLEAVAPTAILEKFEAANLWLSVWDATNDIGIPVFHAELEEGLSGGSRFRLPRCVGSGCHLDPSIALARALNEAAQTRVTVISGVREDLARPRDAMGAEPNPAGHLEGLFFEPVALRIDHADRSGASAGADLRVVANALQTVGIAMVGIVDLGFPEDGLHVIRAVAPGLGHLLPRHKFSRGRRRRLAKGPIS